MRVTKDFDEYCDKGFSGREINSEDFLTRIRTIKKPITLFLGAGINPSGLPRWSEMLGKLLKKALVTYLGSKGCSFGNLDEIVAWMDDRLTVYDKANIISTALKSRYSALVHDGLYSSYTPSMLDDGECYVKPLSELCQSNRVGAVITYNWDDLLEQCLRGYCKKRGSRRSGRRYRTIYREERESLAYGELPIYHVHGYLPWVSPMLSSLDQDIVFSLEEYHRFIREHHTWQVSTQLYHLQQSICIFLGASLTDINMLRLLSTNKEYCDNPDIYQIMALENDIVQYNRKHLSEDYIMVYDRKPVTEDNKTACKEILGQHFRSVGINLITENTFKDIKELLENLAEILDGGGKNGK